MELFKSCSFFSIPVESVKLLPRNGKLMVFVVVLSVILYSSLSSLFGHLFMSLANDMITHSMSDLNSFDANDPSSFTPKTGFDPYTLDPHVKKDVALIITLEIAFVLAMSAALFLSTLSIIIVASASYKAKSLSVKEFFSSIWKTWSRALVTTLYVLMFVFFYFIVFIMLAIPFFIYNTSITLTIAGMLATVFFVFFLYFSVPWVLSIVVSVVEETSSGFDALGKAAVLIKGKRAHGFFLSVAYCVFCMIIVVSCRMALRNKWLLHHLMVYGFLVQSVMYLAKCFLFVAYTVLYFQCKKIHGEEVELYGSTIPYSKLPTTEKGSDMS